MSDRYLIIAGKFNDFVTRALLSGAQETFAEAGVDKRDIDLVWVPGCFEMPTVAGEAARSKRYSAIICLGAVIRGETPHFDYVAGEAARGLMEAGLQSGTPVIFGVLTTDTTEQALSRCGIKSGNKGADAANSALSMVKTMGRLREMINR